MTSKKISNSDQPPKIWSPLEPKEYEEMQKANKSKSNAEKIEVQESSIDKMTGEIGSIGTDKKIDKHWKKV